MKIVGYLFLLFAVIGCGVEEKKPPKPVDDVAKIKKLVLDLSAEAKSIRNKVNGWLNPDSCDGMLWTAQYALTQPDGEVDIEAAEYPDEPGRFARNPDFDCRVSWSRDMGVAGLIPYAWVKGRLDILERHRDYGKEHEIRVAGVPIWQMGKPLDDGRVLYSPAMVGLVYQAILALGGADGGKDRNWTNIYPSGLDDYQAHLQVMGIWLRGEVASAMDDPANVPQRRDTASENKEGVLSISTLMFDRLREHAEREEYNPKYQAIYGLYTGDVQPAIDLLLRPDKPVGSYVRCHELRRCVIAERLFTAWLVLKYLGEMD